MLSSPYIRMITNLDNESTSSFSYYYEIYELQIFLHFLYVKAQEQRNKNSEHTLIR